MEEIPRIISVDDHVLEPGDLWTTRLPAALRDRAPRLVRTKGRFGEGARGDWTPDEDGGWADIWQFEGYQMAIIPGFAAAGFDQDYLGEHWDPMTYDEMRPGAFDQAARLVDLDDNHADASLSFPTFPRFCGQTFLESPTAELGLACVEAYNDWMIDEWCGGAGRGRLIPLTLIPLWDPRAGGGRGARAAPPRAATPWRSRENPAAPAACRACTPGHWDPLFDGVRGDRHRREHAHRLVVDVPPHHAPTRPGPSRSPLTSQGATHALADWLLPACSSGSRRCGSRCREGQVGWMPFLLERLDSVWHDRPGYGGIGSPQRRRARTSTGASAAASSTTSSGCSCATGSASTRSCSRPTTRTATRRGRTQGGAREDRVRRRPRPRRDLRPRPRQRHPLLRPRRASGSTDERRPRRPQRLGRRRHRAPARTADVAVADGRVVAIGTVDDTGHREIDADGRVVCPGFVDVHTHIDAQAFWDPTAQPLAAARRDDGAGRQLRLHDRTARRRPRAST